MTLEPFFSLRPLSPCVYTYDPAQPNAPHAVGVMSNFGGSTHTVSLKDQYNNNEIILGGDPVKPTEQTISDLTADFQRRCTLIFYFYGRNVSTENQYLLLFSLRPHNGPTIAQFFVGNELVRSEEVSGEEQVAILLDVPGDNIPVWVYVRLASTFRNASLGSHGMDCYLL